MRPASLTDLTNTASIETTTVECPRPIPDKSPLHGEEIILIGKRRRISDVVIRFACWSLKEWMRNPLKAELLNDVKRTRQTLLETVLELLACVCVCDSSS